MKVLMFNPYNENMTREIKGAIGGIEQCRLAQALDHPSFEAEFSSCLSGETIIVFFVNDEEDLLFLENIQNKFVDIKLMTILRERTPGFYDRILKLCPRVLAVSGECDRLIPEALLGLVREKIQYKRRMARQKKGMLPDSSAHPIN